MSSIINVDFKNMPIEQIIEKINSIILELPYHKKIDVCQSCRYKNGDFKKYNHYIQDGGFCSVCCNYREVLNYTVVDLVEQAGISIDDYYAFYAPNGKNYSGLRKSLNVFDVQEIETTNRNLEMEKERTTNSNFEILILKQEKYIEHLNDCIRRRKRKAWFGGFLVGSVLVYIIQYVYLN